MHQPNQNRFDNISFVFTYQLDQFLLVISRGRSHHSHYRYIIPKQGDEHVIQGLNNQLTLLGLKNFEDPDLSWMIKNFNKKVKKKYIILIPGASKTGSYKKWPEDRYAKLSNHFIENGFDIYLTGSNEDIETMNLIKASCPLAKIKIDESRIENFLELCQNASFIVANDTGHTHIAALSNRPLFWIAIDNSISKACQPFGKRVIPILSKNISEIDPKKVIEKINSVKLS